MSVLVQMKPKTSIEKKTCTVVDTLMLTPELIDKWKAPPFQRPLKENKKVLALAEQLKLDHGVLPGMITLGVLNEEIYLLDGQHRIAAFKISGLKEGYADIRKHFFETVSEMGDEWVLLNSSLVRMNPDDILRGLESGSEILQLIRKRCPFIGYDNIRRRTNGPIVSMSVALRCWKGAKAETPKLPTASAKDLLESYTLAEAQSLCDFMHIALEAFGRDPEYYRLWGTLNLVMTMWLYRHMVMEKWSAKLPKMSETLFKKCMTGLSATSGLYIDWLTGRMLSDRDRGPAYDRIRKVFVTRMELETGKKQMMPQPAWYNR